MAGSNCLAALGRWTCRGIIVVILSVLGLIFTVPGMLSDIPDFMDVLATNNMPRLENGTCIIDKFHYDLNTSTIFYDVNFESESGGKKELIADAIWDLCDVEKYDCSDLASRMLQNATKQFSCTACSDSYYCRFPILVRLRGDTKLVPYSFLARSVGIWFGFTLTCAAASCITVILVFLNFILPCFIKDTDNVDEAQSLLAGSTKDGYETPGKPLKAVI